MVKLSLLLFLLLGSLCAVAQGPPSLDLYTSATHHFRFAYPDTYDLLEGEGILKRTQGKQVGIPVCDLLTAIACVVYPDDDPQDPSFEAAAFSVNEISKGASEQDCLDFTDQLPRPTGEGPATEPVHLNGELLRYAFTTSTRAGHSQFVQRYRSFHKDRCYELRISVSLLHVAAALSPDEKFPDNQDANKADRSLELILRSFAFLD